MLDQVQRPMPAASTSAVHPTLAVAQVQHFRAGRLNACHVYAVLIVQLLVNQCVAPVADARVANPVWL
jgi:hypothetical protein